MTTTDHQQQGQQLMEEQGQTRPRVTFFAPARRRQLSGRCPEDWDFDFDCPLPSGHARAHELQLLEERVRTFDEAKKKTHRLHKQLQRQFLKEQERRMAWRKKTAEQFKKSLEVFDRRSGKVPDPASRLPADQAKPSGQAGAADSKATK